MLNIFMINYLKIRLVSNNIFICFGKDYVQITPLVQADEFGQSFLERYKGVV